MGRPTVNTSVRLHSLIIITSLLFAAGCPAPRRVPNQSYVVGLQIAPVNSRGPDADEAQSVGGVVAVAQIAETDKNWQSLRARADLAVGANANGFAGQLTFDGQVGMALWDTSNHLFGRVGIFGTLETDPVTGYSALELPTVWFGYQHHGRDSDDTVHFDIGPRFSFGIAGRASAHGDRSDFVAAPSAGGAMLLMGELLTLELTYAHFFETDEVEVLRGSACFAGMFAVCLDTRHIFANFGTADTWDATAYYGVRFGLGIASGRSPPL